MIETTTRWTGRLVLVLAVLGTIGCDRVTKHVATTTLAGTPARSYLADTIRLEYAENRGGFLSLGATWPRGFRTAIFTGGTALALVGLTLLAIRRRWGGGAAVGLALFVGGGVSNWFDRVAWGSVVDFMNVGIGPVRTGIFNVADIAIVLGAVVYIYAGLRQAPEHGVQSVRSPQR